MLKKGRRADYSCLQLVIKAFLFFSLEPPGSRSDSLLDRGSKLCADLVMDSSIATQVKFMSGKCALTLG